MRHIKSLLSILVILNITYAISGTIDPCVNDSKYIEYGRNFDCVVSIFGTQIDNSLFCASAVLIDDHHLLTAAHVVNKADLCFVEVSGSHHTINNIIINKDFELKTGVADIALCYCAEGFNLDSYPDLYTKNDELKKICSISGYGFTGTFLTGAKKFDTKKRAGLNIIDSVHEDLLICSPSTEIDITKTELEFFIASGDSGGGLFIENKLAGINSCIMALNISPESRYGEESGHIRISKFIDWIQENKIK